MRHYPKILLFLLCVLQTKTDIINLKVRSKVDLITPFALVKNTITFANKGPEVIRTYQYATNDSNLFKISFYNATGTPLKFQKLQVFEVDLDTELKPNETFRLICKQTFAQKIVPAVQSRKMEELQLMKFENNLKFFSEYPTVFCKIEYVLKNDSLVEVTKIPTRESTNKLVFIFYDTPKRESSQVTLVFVNNAAFFVIRSLVRTIDINHFGKILISDEVVLQNNGPRFVGPFNPLDKPIALRRSFYTHLPASAENIEVSDTLGINFKHQVYNLSNFKTLNFKTRYPLLGGWKTSYTVKYDVPIYEYLFIGNESFFLRIRAIDYVVDAALLENAVVKVVLPEGAKLVRVAKPEILNWGRNELSCPRSLCVFGRPTIVLIGKELFDDYVTLLGVEYSLEAWKLVRAPAVIIAYLEVVFVLLICSRKFLF